MLIVTMDVVALKFLQSKNSPTLQLHYNFKTFTHGDAPFMYSTNGFRMATTLTPNGNITPG